MQRLAPKNGFHNFDVSFFANNNDGKNPITIVPANNFRKHRNSLFSFVISRSSRISLKWKCIKFERTTMRPSSCLNCTYFYYTSTFFVRKDSSTQGMNYYVRNDFRNAYNISTARETVKQINCTNYKRNKKKKIDHRWIVDLSRNSVAQHHLSRKWSNFDKFLKDCFYDCKKNSNI